MARTTALDVWMYGVQVARVTERRTGRFQLAYCPEALERWTPGRPLLSVSLPLTPEQHPPAVVGPFLEGLLPEGEMRTVLEARYGVRRGDVLGLLAEIGRDCAGAVVLLPAGHPPPALPAGRPEPLSDEDLVREIRALPERPLGDDERVRVSLAGQQAKLVVTRLPDGRWARPVDGQPSTHILKPGDERYPGMAANEAFCLRMARHLGLADIDVDLLDVGGIPVLVVSRYDREVASGGTLVRIHQEDVCQALAVDVGPLGAGKYEDHGGPSLRDVAGILDVHNGDPGQTALLAEVAALTVAVGNADAHGKNLSLLHFPDRPLRLAPLYDVVSTIQYPALQTPDGPRDVSTSLGMRINSLDSIHAVTLSDVLAEAARWHHGPALEGRLRSLVERLPEAIDAAAAATPQVPGGLVDLVAARAENLAADHPAGPNP